MPILIASEEGRDNSDCGSMVAVIGSTAESHRGGPMSTGRLSALSRRAGSVDPARPILPLAVLLVHFPRQLGARHSMLTLFIGNIT